MSYHTTHFLILKFRKLISNCLFDIATWVLNKHLQGNISKMEFLTYTPYPPTFLLPQLMPLLIDTIALAPKLVVFLECFLSFTATSPCAQSNLLTNFIQLHLQCMSQIQHSPHLHLCHLGAQLVSTGHPASIHISPCNSFSIQPPE